MALVSSGLATALPGGSPSSGEAGAPPRVEEQQSGEPSAAPQQSHAAPTFYQEGTCSKGLLSVAFNQDHGCFACGTNSGFRIYNCDPFKETFRRELQGGIGSVEMLFRSNILALVGGGNSPKFPPNKVMIWDDHQSMCIGELLFKSEVRGVRLRRDRIVVVLEHKIYVYNFSDLQLVQQIETIVNPKGLCALAPNSPSPILACPGLHKGQIRVEHYGLRKSKFITAHDAHLACFTLSLDGKVLATASTRGTLIRVFSTIDGTQLQELRRGSEKAEIYSIAISANAQWLAVSSDKNTVHVFSLKSATALDNELKTVEAHKLERALSVSPSSSPGGNPGSTLSFMKGVLPKYFSSEWSFAQYRLPEEMNAIVAFGSQKNSVLVVGLDARFYKCVFDPLNGGEMIQTEYANFMKPEERML